MSTLTLHIEDDRLLEKAARVARQRSTSLDEMVSGFFSSLPDSAPREDEQARRRDKLAAELRETFNKLSREWGGRGYVHRDELYER